MVTIISTILGFLGSLIPQGLKVYQDVKDKEHELRIFQLQIELQKEGHLNKLEEIAIQQDVNQQTEMYRTFYSGVTWVDTLNALVRPVLTFSFFGLYVFIKVMQYQFVQNEAFDVIIETLWAGEDQALFASIIAFYFGNRTFNKLLNRRR